MEDGHLMITTDVVRTRRPRMVLVAADVVGGRMAGPGLRVVEIAAQMSHVADVTLAVGIDGSDTESLRERGVTIETFGDSDALSAIIARHDIAYCQLIDPAVVRRGIADGCRFIFDLYNALPAEAVGAERVGGFDTQPEMDTVFRDVLSFFRFCVRSGSYFVTSNERQRDFWIGYMMASEALLPSTLRGRHPSEIIGLVPFGMDSSGPVAEQHPIRGTRGIGIDDIVLLWAGGIWDWFDAETPIRAVAEIRRSRPDVHLVFYGTTHPNALIGKPRTVERAQALAAELGVLDVGVHFIEGWVPADERAGYLLDADAAVSTHKESFETRYAFRTRILDHFWARLPSIVSQGDWFADYISQHDLGKVVPYGDVAGTRSAIESLCDDARRAVVREHIDAIRSDWSWTTTTAPLREAVENWQSSLLPGVIVDDAATPQSPPQRSRLRESLSRTYFGAFYRRLRKRGAA